jgi:hypothetical protein
MPLIDIAAGFMGKRKRPVLTGLLCIAVPYSTDAVRKRIEETHSIQNGKSLLGSDKSKCYRRFRASRPDFPKAIGYRFFQI